MKTQINTFFILQSVFCLLLAFPSRLSSQEITGNIYVWEFTTRDGVRNDITQSLTEEFEEAMIQSECCNVLQRRHYARLLDQKQNETAIRGLNDMPQDKASALKSLDGNTVVFGEVYDDTNSGQVKFSVNFESFNGKILKKASTYVPKYDLANPAKREAAVDKIMEELNLFPLRQREPLEVKTLGEWEFSLTGCRRVGSDAICGFVVTSHYRDRNLTIYGHRYSTAQDEFSYDYQAKAVKLANQQGGSVNKLLVSDISAVGQLTIPNISKRATRFTILSFSVKGDDLSESYIKFRDVKIQ